MSARPMLTTDLNLDEGPGESSLPERIGKYRVLSRLGEGATSEVFLAEDSFQRRKVAIKRVRAAGWGDAVDRHYRGHFFAAEAALVGKLNHPNVVSLLDAVADCDQPYLVMEYVPGTTLRAYCRPDALLPLDQIVDIGFKCANALGYMARQGLCHRDVKPANILAMVEDGRVHNIKLTDFGSAFDHHSERTQIFRVGSLSYMSPEQLDGSTPDARADQFSLAAVLYHLIAGRPPFDGQTQGALMHQICQSTPPPLISLREGVPERMDELLQRALAKRPEHRLADWDVFADRWSTLATSGEVAPGRQQDVLDAERFTLLRGLDFFAGFGDVELWEVVHRAQWLRHGFGDALYRKGQQGNTFHIIAQGQVEVYRDGQRVAQLGAGTSVGEMAYLAPSPDLRTHAVDVIVSQTALTIAFTPAAMQVLGPTTRHLFDAAFIRVLVRRLHAAHEALAHPRRIL